MSRSSIESEPVFALITSLSRAESLSDCFQAIQCFLSTYFSPLNITFHLPNLGDYHHPSALSEKWFSDICSSPVQGAASGQILDELIPFGEDSVAPIHRYCIPLVTNQQVLGVIHLDFALDFRFTDSQFQFLTQVQPLFTQSIHRHLLCLQMDKQTQFHQDELRQISRNLHDSVGQSIGFIRLKMEQIRHDFPDRRYPELAEDLERIQSVAEEAYEQVRGLLAELRPDNVLDLTTSLTEMAQSYSERSHFTLNIQEIGTPATLAPLTKRQVLLIFREAFNNIEKHACADQVELNILWSDSTCHLALQDDGVGFDPEQISPIDHYGLVIMRERAQDIAADFQVISAPGTGTRIEIVLKAPHQ